VAGYSNVGAAVDIYAPGDYIHSSGNSGTEGPVSANVRIDYGTSMASPHVAATVALLRQKNPALTSDQLKAKILDSGDSWGSLGGAKTLNAHDALYITNYFQDVPWGTQFYEEIEWARASSISTGWTSGSTRLYKPTVAINRDAMAAFLYRMAGSPAYTPPKVSPFKDVATTQKFYKEMAWLKSQGISTGYSNGTYRPLQPINRDAMAAFLYRMAGSPAYAAPTASPFQDVVRGQQFYKEMAWMKSTEISTGFSDGTYRALNHVNRDAMAAFLYRLAPLV
jgi:serine protease